MIKGFLKEFQKIQSYYFIVTAVVSATMYVQTNFASAKRVEMLEDRMVSLHNILCAMAIEQRLAKAESICTMKEKQ